MEHFLIPLSQQLNFGHNVGIRLSEAKCGRAHALLGAIKDASYRVIWITASHFREDELDGARNR